MSIRGVRQRWRRKREPWPRWARALSSGWVVWPFGVASLLITYMLVYGAFTTAPPPEFSRGGAFGSPDLPGSPNSSVDPTGSGTIATSPTGTVSPTGTGTTRPSVRPTATATKTLPPPPPGLVLPTPGAYNVQVDGTEQPKFSFVPVCGRRFPTSSTMYVRRIDGNSFQFDHAYSSLHEERHIYDYTDDGVFMTFEGASVSCGPRTETSEGDFSPPDARVRLPLRVGASWRGTSTARNPGSGEVTRNESYEAKVLRTEKLVVAGTQVETYLIETSTSFTGPEHGNRLLRWWYSRTLAMPVKWYEKINAARSGGSYTSEVTVTMVDLNPR
jgi:hypothetical protein